jgi:Ca2+-binding EF-hand superfamily protein
MSDKSDGGKDNALTACFTKFDRDGGGSLDVFELGPCLAEALGRAEKGPVATSLVQVVCKIYDADGSGKIDLDEFLAMVKGFDWAGKGSELEKQDAELLKQQGLYEAVFRKKSMGFKVKNDKQNPGEALVSSIDEDNQGHMFLGDTVVAVNGAPLGYANGPRALAIKVKDLLRPLKITFRRNNNEDAVSATNASRLEKKKRRAMLEASKSAAPSPPLPSPEKKIEVLPHGEVKVTQAGETKSNSADTNVADSKGGHLNDERQAKKPSSGFTKKQITEAFRKYDRDGSNSLDTFELGDALASLVGRSIPTAEMVRSNQQMVLRDEL